MGFMFHEKTGPIHKIKSKTKTKSKITPVYPAQHSVHIKNNFIFIIRFCICVGYKFAT